MSSGNKPIIAVLKEEIELGHTIESLNAAFQKTDALKEFKSIVDRNGATILNFEDSQVALKGIFEEVANSPKTGLLGRLMMKGIQRLQDWALSQDGLEDFEWKTDTLAIQAPLESVEQIRSELKALDIVEKVGQPNFTP